MRINRFCCLICLAATATILALAGGCGDHRATPAARAKPQVVATISIIGDWAKIVGGDDIDLKILVGPDGDPHEYEPLPSDNVTLLNADVILENGLGLESWLDKLYQSSQSKALRVPVTQGIDVRFVSVKDRDPHAWQNVRNAMAMVSNMRAGLVKVDPAHTAGYQSRADAYLKQLADLDAWAQEQINTLPQARRKLVTSHDAFGYFGQRYGVDISRNALESVTTEASDPSARQIADVVMQIKASGVPVIFPESMQKADLIKQLASEAGVRIGSKLYTDALGKPGSDGDSYVKMMQYNVRTLVKELGQ